MATLLATVTKLCERQGIPVPATVYGSNDPQTVQVRALLEEGLDALVDRGVWQELNREATHTTLAQEDQGAITTIAANFKWLLPETLWDRTDKIPLVGPQTPRDWQALKAVVVTGPRYQFRIRLGRFLVTPSPPAGNTWAFEYMMDCWGESTAGSGSYLKAFNNDLNNILLPDPIVIADLRWRWKRQKGLDYAQDFEDAEFLINNALGRSGMKPVLSMDGHDKSPVPGVFVPQFNWNL